MFAQYSRLAGSASGESEGDFVLGGEFSDHAGYGAVGEG